MLSWRCNEGRSVLGGGLRICRSGEWCRGGSGAGEGVVLLMGGDGCSSVGEA